MRLNFWPFNRRRRQSRYTLNVHKDLPLADLIAILQHHTPVISAREWSKLSPHLRGYFLKIGGK